MKYFTLTIFAAAVVLCSGTVMAADDGIDGCIEAIMKIDEVNISKVESLQQGSKRLYEFEIKDKDGNIRDLTCDATSLKILESEEKVSSTDKNLFRRKAKISETEAIKTALKSYPGEVVEIEYEIKQDGSPTFEIDVNGKDGQETKVEVDAVTGKVLAALVEKWEIGSESDQ